MTLVFAFSSIFEFSASPMARFVAGLICTLAAACSLGLKFGLSPSSVRRDVSVA